MLHSVTLTGNEKAAIFLASRGAKAALANLKVCGIANMPIFVTGSKMKIRGEGAVTFNRQMAKYGNFTQHS